MFFQSPDDVMVYCVMFANLLDPVVEFLNVFLNALGFFIPPPREFCDNLYGFLDSLPLW
jgi:hypothetical protein